MPYPIIQQAGGLIPSTGTTFQLTLKDSGGTPRDVTPGDLLFLAGCNYQGHLISSVTSPGAVWAQIPDCNISLGGATTADGWYADPETVTGGAGSGVVTIIYAASTSANQAGCGVYELPGVASGAPDASMGSTGTATDTIPSMTTDSIDLSEDNELVISIFSLGINAIHSGGRSPGYGDLGNPPYGEIFDHGNTQSDGMMGAFPAGSLVATDGSNDTTGFGYACFIVAFKPLANQPGYDYTIEAGATEVVLTGFLGAPDAYTAVLPLTGEAVGSGSITENSIELDLPDGGAPPGNILVRYTKAGVDVDSINILSLRDNPDFPSPPPAGTVPNAGNDGGTRTDSYAHGIAPPGYQRYGINNADNPTVEGSSGLNPGGTIAGIEEEIALDRGAAGYYNPAYADDARPRPIVIAFPGQQCVSTPPRTITGTITLNGTTALVDSAGSFATTDVGKTVSGTDVFSGATISAYVSATQVTMSHVATGSLTGGTVALSGAPAYVSQASYSAGVTAAVAALGPGTTVNAEFFEMTNEPQGQFGLSIAQSALQYSIFAAAVHAGNAAAKAVGPCEVSYFPNGAGLGYPISNFVIWLSLITVPLDGCSGHFYNSRNGNFDATIGIETAFRDALVTAGYASNLPQFRSEVGDVTAYQAVYDPRRECQWLASYYLALERVGIDIENTYYFYDASHGFNYQSWIKNQSGDLRFHAGYFRVRAEERRGKTYSGALDFGPVANHFYLGNVCRGTDGTMVELLAQGNPGDAVTLAVSDTGSITYSDVNGKLFTVEASGGHVGLPAGDTPIYARFSPGCAIAGINPFSDTNLALEATASVDAGSDPVLINNGVFETGTYLGASDMYFLDETDALPNWAQLTWDTPQTLSEGLIRQTAPWTNYPASVGAMVTGTLQYLNDEDEWVNCPTVPGRHWDDDGNYSNDTAASSVMVIQGGDNGIGSSNWVFSPYDNNWNHRIVFSSPVTTTALRLTVSTSSRGHVPDLAGITNSNFGHFGISIPESLVVSEFLAFPKGAAAVTTVNVVGTYLDGVGGAPVSGFVTFQAVDSVTEKPIYITNDDDVIRPTPIVAALVDGQFSVTLVATDSVNVTPSGWSYLVKEQFAGGRKYLISVPSSSAPGPVDLSALVTA